MSAKCSSALDDQLTASSSEEDEVEALAGDGEEIDGSSSSEEEDDPSSKKPTVVKKPESNPAVAAATDKNAAEVPNSESESEYESDSDSESETEKNDPGKNQVSSSLKPNAETKDSLEVVKKDGSETSLDVAAATDKNAAEVPDSESESDYETDSDSETEKKDAGKNPESSCVKPDAENKISSAVAKKADLEKVEVVAESRDKKRSMETEGAAEAKRVKRGSGEDEKMSGEVVTRMYQFQRVWSDEDEIALLQGMIDYKKETMSSPNDDTNVFYHFAKKSISFDVSKTKLTEKLRNMKKKFKKNVAEGKLFFSKPLDQKAFDLSKIVWGSLSELPVESNVKPKKVESVNVKLLSPLMIGTTNAGEDELDLFGKSDVAKFLAHFGVDDDAVQQGWSRLGVEDKKKIEERLKAFRVTELEYYSERSGLFHDVVTKMAEASRSNP